MDIAVIGGGVSGLVAAYLLRRQHHVELFESRTTAGGHANTVMATNDAGEQVALDVGFIVYNERTYPLLIALFAELGIEPAPTDMSFAASIGPHQFEWCGSNIRSLFAQPSNLLRPGFWRMLRDILTFNEQSVADFKSGALAGLSLGEASAAVTLGSGRRLVANLVVAADGQSVQLPVTGTTTVQEVRRATMGGLTAAGPGAAFAMQGVVERGGHLGMLVDQHFTRGVVVDFLGQPAPVQHRDHLVADLEPAAGCVDFGDDAGHLGAGREQAIRSLQAAGLEVTAITDVTPIPHNGCRPPKRRRV